MSDLRSSGGYQLMIVFSAFFPDESSFRILNKNPLIVSGVSGRSCGHLGGFFVLFFFVSI